MPFSFMSPVRRGMSRVSTRFSCSAGPQHYVRIQFALLGTEKEFVNMKVR